jgi:AraC-like DNA-binding protein
LTAKSDIEHQMEGYEAGADLYVPKPFSLKFLELNVTRLIAHKNQLCQTENVITSNIHFTDATGTTVREAIKDSKEKDFINKLNDLIIANLDNPSFSVEKICKELGVGRTKLYTKVKDLSGQPLGDLIRDIRLNKAASLLRNTDNNITEIIYEVGFGSNSHFSKAFKVKFGMTPSEYAKKA